ACEGMTCACGDRVDTATATSTTRRGAACRCPVDRSPGRAYRGRTMPTRVRTFVTGLLAALAVGLACNGGGPQHPEGIGNYCEADDQCATNLCYLGPGGGYCTSPC